MITIFRHSLGRSRGQILGWGIALCLLGLMMVWFYPQIAEQQETFDQLLEAYPPEFSAFFGDLSAMATPDGFITIEFFSYMPLVLGVFAVLAGSGLLASDEERGTLDLVLAHPVSRTGLFIGRVLAFIVTTLAILFISWLGIVLAKTWFSVELDGFKVALPFVSLLAELLFFGAFALLMSMVLPSRRLAAMVSGLFLVASFFITGLARLSDDLQTIAKLSPLNYYQTQEAFEGLNITWLAGLLALALLFGIVAWWRFERRDIRVGGEGGWGVSLPWRRSAATS